MKILQLNIFYKQGSTGKIVYDLHNLLLNDGIDSYVCYGRGPVSTDLQVVKFGLEAIAKISTYLSCLTGYKLGHNSIGTFSLLYYIRKIKPDIIHIHCLNCQIVDVYSLLSKLSKMHLPIVLTLHAELMFTANCDHAFDCDKWINGCKNCPDIWTSINSLFFDRTEWSWKKMRQIMYRFDRLKIVAVSSWLKDRASKSFLSKFPVEVIHNGVDVTNTFYYRYDDKFSLDKNLESNFILHVTPSFRSLIKGGDYVIELAKRLPEIQFVIIGFDSDPSILPPNVLALNKTENQDQLAQYYSRAQLTLLTSKRETFSMVCAESLCCGTPVVGFQAGGPETIALKDYSEFVPFGQLDELERVVRLYLGKELDKAQISSLAKLTYSRENMFRRYLDIYKSFNV